MVRRLLPALFVLLLLSAGAGLFAVHLLLEQELQVSGEEVYVLEEGAGLSRMTRELAERGWLRQPRLVSLAARLTGLYTTIKVGEYRVVPGTRFSALLDIMRNGVVIQYRLTLPEGWNFQQVRAHLAAETRLRAKTTAMDDASVMAALGYPGMHPEGRFFPDTYVYASGLSDLDLLAQAYQRMNDVLQAEWSERAEGLPYETSYEALIMASIIEKETGQAAERGQIAGVFVRRLQKGMRLQTDPTVIYGLGPLWSGNLTRAHLRQATAYNTYVIPGLPPTPIAMPGRDAIHAALHPEAGDALFFVARGDGSHHFSATLAEHNAAVKKYQVRHRARNYRSSPGRETP